MFAELWTHREELVLFYNNDIKAKSERGGAGIIRYEDMKANPMLRKNFARNLEQYTLEWQALCSFGEETYGYPEGYWKVLKIYQLILLHSLGKITEI